MVSYHFDDDVLVLKSGARFSTMGLAAVLEAALNDSRFSNGMFLLFDNRDSEESASTEEIRRRLRILDECPVSRRCAIVVSDGLHYGLGRIAASYGLDLGLEIELFEDVTEAKDWLRALRRVSSTPQAATTPTTPAPKVSGIRDLSVKGGTKTRRCGS